VEWKKKGWPAAYVPEDVAKILAGRGTRRGRVFRQCPRHLRGDRI
jgi:hypothetical protein